MNPQQLIGTAFEYSTISSLSIGISNDMVTLISLMRMYDRPHEEMKLLSDVRLLLTQYHFTYTQSALEKSLLNK